ncbi:MAG: LysM peptidoglycan-binding domain-containing protein [Verrucomicrobiota bacterium]
MRLLSLSALALLTVVTPSCTLFHPKQGADAYGTQPPASANPYGEVPQSNPYATPPATTYGQPPGAASNPYSQTPASNPYATQPAASPYGGYEQAQTYPSTPKPSYNPPAQSYSSGGGGGQVVVQPGDNLTKIAKRNNTTISALKSANGLTTDLIRVGQKLNLP